MPNAPDLVVVYSSTSMSPSELPNPITWADELADPDRFAGLVVDPIDRRQNDQDRLPAPHLVLRFERTPHHRLGRHAVDPLGERPHEIGRSAGNAVRLKAVGPQVRQHFEHRLVDALGAPAFFAAVSLYDGSTTSSAPVGLLN